MVYIGNEEIEGFEEKRRERCPLFRAERVINNLF
jgi:hypothetical protein